MHTSREMNPSKEILQVLTWDRLVLQQVLKSLCFNDRVITYKLCNLTQSPFCSKVQSALIEQILVTLNCQAVVLKMNQGNT